MNARLRSYLLAVAVAAATLTTCSSQRGGRMVSVTTPPQRCLECAAEATDARDQKDVTWKGQDLEAGRSALRMKLFGQGDARVTLRQVPGRRVHVELRVDPPQSFRRPPRLELHFDRCTDAEIGEYSWTIWRQNDDGSWHDLHWTQFNAAARRASVEIDHNSNYMIAD